MPLLGSAAMLLTFDVVAEAIAEHDDWHTHEHLSERLSIPGFIRGSRWVAAQRHPRYLVIYEVEELATLTSSAYLQRLNNPSPWTAKMMPHYRGMTRGLASAHLLEGAVTPAMTNEQRIRGADATVDWALVLTGYSQNAVMDLAEHAAMSEQLGQRGAIGTLSLLYQLEYVLDARELDA